MNKKKVIGILLIASMIFNIGCTNNINSVKKEDIKSKEVVFEENVLESSNSVKITQEEVNFIVPEEDTEFLFYSYKDGKLYGTLDSILESEIKSEGTEKFPLYGVSKENLYEAGEDLVVKDTGNKLLTYFEGEGIRGINSNIFGEERECVYYYDYESNEKKVIANENYLASARSTVYIEDEIEIINERLVEGNDALGYILYNYKRNGKSLTSLKIIDMENEKVYSYKSEGYDTRFIVDVVYDKNTEKLYGINQEGIIYEVEFESNNIVLNEKEKLNLGGIALWNEEQVSINKDGDIVIFYAFITDSYTSNHTPIYQEKYMGNVNEGNELLIKYNLSTNEVQRVMQGENMDFQVISFWENSNLFLLKKDKKDGKEEEYYIGELKEDKIDIYHKIDIMNINNKHVVCYNSIINEDNTEILLQFRKFDLYRDDYNDFENEVIKINIER